MAYSHSIISALVTFIMNWRIDAGKLGTPSTEEVIDCLRERVMTASLSLDDLLWAKIGEGVAENSAWEDHWKKKHNTDARPSLGDLRRHNLWKDITSPTGQAVGGSIIVAGFIAWV